MRTALEAKQFLDLLCDGDVQNGNGGEPQLMGGSESMPTIRGSNTDDFVLALSHAFNDDRNGRQEEVQLALGQALHAAHPVLDGVLTDVLIPLGRLPVIPKSLDIEV